MKIEHRCIRVAAGRLVLPTRQSAFGNWLERRAQPLSGGKLSGRHSAGQALIADIRQLTPFTPEGEHANNGGFRESVSDREPTRMGSLDERRRSEFLGQNQTVSSW